MRYVFDIDGTICTPGEGCGTCQYDEGHYIIYMTARAMGRNKDKPHEEASKAAHELLYPLTQAQLNMWGCKYHELIMGKPHADLFIDDKGISDEDFFRKIRP